MTKHEQAELQGMVKKAPGSILNLDLLRLLVLGVGALSLVLCAIYNLVDPPRFGAKLLFGYIVGSAMALAVWNMTMKVVLAACSAAVLGRLEHKPGSAGDTEVV